MDLIPLFIETVEDLRSRSALTSTSYDAVQASGLLRRLLTDGGAVGARADRELQERGWIDTQPSATWGTGSVLRSSARGSVWVATHQLDPALLAPSFNLRRAPDALEGWVKSGSLAKLLGVEVLTSDDGEVLPGVTVKQLIQHAAIALGGVHHGDRLRKPAPELVQRAVEGAMPDLLWVLRALGRVVVRAYEPLVCAALINGGLTQPRG